VLRLKRTKDGAAHYATAVMPSGVVGGWSKDAGAAVALTEGVAKRVRDRYAGKKNVGEFVFEKVDATDMQLASAAVVEDEVGAAEFGKLQKRCKGLESQVADLEKVVDEARESVRQNERAAKDARNDLLEADDLAEHLRDEIKELAAKAANLEVELAKAMEAATQPATPPPQPPEPSTPPADPKPPEPEPKGRKAK